MTEYHKVFEALLDILHIVFTSPTKYISEEDYHTVVECMRQTDALRGGHGEELSEAEVLALRERNWAHYNPFIQPFSRIRLTLAFCNNTTNPALSKAIQAFNETLS